MDKTRYILLICFLFVLFPAAYLRSANPSADRAELVLWTVGGSEGKAARFGANFSCNFQQLKKNQEAMDALLLALAEYPKNERQISQISGLPESVVSILISSLQSIKIIRKMEGKWATTLPVITNGRMLILKKTLNTVAQLIIEAVQARIPGIKSLYEVEKSPSDPTWDAVAHLVIDKFLLDGAFHRAIGILEREKGIRALYSQNQQHLPSFFLERGENFLSFGTNWYPFQKGDEQREIYVLHGDIWDRFHIRLNNYREDPNLASLLFKINPEGRINSPTNQEREILDELKWIAGNRFLVPVVRANTIKALLPLIERTGRDAAGLVFENYSVITESFNNSPFFNFLDGAGDYIQVCYHTLFSLIIDGLIKENIIPPIPKPVPEPFGVFIIYGRVF